MQADYTNGFRSLHGIALHINNRRLSNYGLSGVSRVFPEHDIYHFTDFMNTVYVIKYARSWIVSCFLVAILGVLCGSVTSRVYCSNITWPQFASQITGQSTVCSTACSGQHQSHIKTPHHWPPYKWVYIAMPGQKVRNAESVSISWRYHGFPQRRWSMMTSSNGNIFRVTGPLCGDFTGPGEFPAQRPVTRIFDVFFDLRPNKRLSKQPLGWWFETPSWSLWRHSNGYHEWIVSK